MSSNFILYTCRTINTSIGKISFSIILVMFIQSYGILSKKKKKVQALGKIVLIL